MIGENDFERATQDALKTLWAVMLLPNSKNRTRAIDDLRAAIGWIELARDEWAIQEAAQ